MTLPKKQKKKEEKLAGRDQNDHRATGPYERHVTKKSRTQGGRWQSLENNSQTPNIAIAVRRCYCPLLASLRLYRFSTEARFSFPLGKATSPAAVPLLPLRPETAVSTSLIVSRTTPAVVKVPRIGMGMGPMAVSPLPGGLLSTLMSF